MVSTSVDFGRVLTAMVTPMTADGGINYTIVEQLAAHLIANGSDTLVVCGTTGESPTLTWDEEADLFRAVKSAVDGKAKIIAGTGSNSTREAIDYTQKAAKIGVDGSLQVVPYYNKPPQAGLYQHFKTIAESCPDLPLMLYNVPGRTGKRLEADTIARLAEIPNIVAIKEASGDLELATQIRRQTSPEFEIYSGEDSLTLPLLSVGCKGVVSVASHLVGDKLQGMVRAFEAGKNQEAIDIHLQLFPLFKALFVTTNPIPIKRALALQGWDVGKTRSPLCEGDETLDRALTTAMSPLGLLA